MKTKIIKLPTPILREDLKYQKFCKSEELSYKLRETPLDIDIEKSVECIRLQAIEENVAGGTIISTSSKIINDVNRMEPMEEITINYTEPKSKKVKVDKDVCCPICKVNHYRWVWEDMKE